MKQDSPWLELGDKTYRALRGQGLVLIDLDAVERSIISGDAGQALYQLMEQYRSQEMLDGKAIAVFQRAMTGWVLGAGTEGGADQMAAPLPISLTPPADAALRRSLRVLSMVAELHKAGYQRLRIAAGMSPSGCYWRCHITPVDNIRANGWEPLDWDDGIASYTSGDEDRYFGWKDAPGKTARQLAQLFVERFPELALRGVGRDRPYAGWFVGMLGAAESGRLPIFFADQDLEPVEAEMPPPCGVGGITDRDEDGAGLIANKDLLLTHLPRPNAPWKDIEPFCTTYDGYAGGRRSIDECLAIADRIVKTGLGQASMDELRILLFIRQRAARWHTEMPVAEQVVRLARAAIEEIRLRLINDESSTENGAAQTIVEVGAEGGSIRLVGMSDCGGEWKFRLETSKFALVNEDFDGSPASPIVWLNSWRGALKALDQYPWPNLYPLAVHSDFRKKIVSALKVRLPVDDESAWRSWLDLLAQQAR